MTLVVPVGVWETVAGECRAAAPAEACGLLIGPAGGDRVTRSATLANVAADPYTRFVFDPDEQLAVYRAMDMAGEDPLAVWHSHPTGLSRLSTVDVAMMRHDPTLAWLVIALPAFVVRMWRLSGEGALTELTLTVTEDDNHEHTPGGAAAAAG